jgi:chromosome segregation ATPase
VSPDSFAVWVWWAVPQAEQKDLEHSKAFLEDEVGKVTTELERVVGSVAALKEKADAIRAESDKLSAVVKAGSGWTPDQKLRSKELEETRDDLRAQLEGKQTALNALRRDIDALQEHIDRGGLLWASCYGVGE